MARPMTPSVMWYSTPPVEGQEPVGVLQRAFSYHHKYMTVVCYIPGMIITASGLLIVPVALSDTHITCVELKSSVFGKVIDAFISPLTLELSMNLTPLTYSCRFLSPSFRVPFIVHSNCSPLILQLKVTFLTSLGTTWVSGPSNISVYIHHHCVETQLVEQAIQQNVAGCSSYSLTYVSDIHSVLIGTLLG